MIGVPFSRLFSRQPKPLVSFLCWGRRGAVAGPPLVPPFTEETARLKVKAAEQLWNTRDPARVCLGYTEDTRWRNRDEFLEGRAQVQAFLDRKWARELDYRLRKELFAFTAERIAVHFEYEWHDEQGQWYRSYGNEHWTFAPSGLMKTRDASINDVKISESERRIGLERASGSP
eukprot:RCo013182